MLIQTKNLEWDTLKTNWLQEDRKWEHIGRLKKMIFKKFGNLNWRYGDRMEIRDDDNWEVAPAEIMKLKRSVR